jgi:hypothetical protein
MAPRKKKPTKYEWMSELLGLYGRDVITSEQFWSRMKTMGYGQDDIDKWCERYHELQIEAAALAERQAVDDKRNGRWS